MEYDPIETHLRTITDLFDVNVKMSDEVPEFVNSLSEASRKSVMLEYKHRLKHSLLGMKDFYRATACTARDEQAARQFFEDVYKYAFEGGEEPDVTDYWDRPKPTDW